MALGMLYLYYPKYACCPMVYCTIGEMSVLRIDIYISAWSSELLVSTLLGNSQDALDSEASDEWASRFYLCVSWILFIVTSMLKLHWSLT